MIHSVSDYEFQSFNSARSCRYLEEISRVRPVLSAIYRSLACSLQRWLNSCKHCRDTRVAPRRRIHIVKCTRRVVFFSHFPLKATDIWPSFDRLFLLNVQQSHKRTTISLVFRFICVRKFQKKIDLLGTLRKKLFLPLGPRPTYTKNN